MLTDVITMARKAKVLVVALLCVSAGVLAQDDDPVIMKINGKPVLRSEYEYSYNRNNTEGVIDKKSVEEYVDLFVNYKLKVEAALDARLDTMTSYKEEFGQYRDQLIRPEFVSDEDMEREVVKTYNQYRDNIGDKGRLRLQHIWLKMRQDASEQTQIAVEHKIDSIYNILLKGAKFEEVASRESEDVSAKNGGKMPWLVPNNTLKEIEDVAYSLSLNEMSKPFKSVVGWHILRLVDKQPCEPLDSVHNSILTFLERRGMRDRIINQNLDSLAKAEGCTPAQLLDSKAEDMMAKDPEMKYLIQEYHDGLLLYEISNNTVWNKAQTDEAGLAACFKKNKKKYTASWSPVFRGIVYHVKDEDMVNKVAKCVKKVAFEKWGDVLKETFNSDSVVVRVEKGYFKKGDNAIVDKQVYGVESNKEVKRNPKFPIDATFGKILKKPETWLDTKAQVIADYQDKLMEDWVKELRRRYSVEVYDDVVKTVKVLK